MLAGFWCLSIREWRTDKSRRAERKFQKEALLPRAESPCGSNEAIYFVSLTFSSTNNNKQSPALPLRFSAPGCVKQLACPTASPLLA